ncbi:hypothetical protein PIB30_059531 [Stylosanthes scabra]|uniref:Uncharacterized protein n=1 Tax=Stylosanthes scabra TaxID=79078 RepID=A0ABU6SK98_9FABA|nr:hypothetical protein [Stylosanthes scabra]
MPAVPRALDMDANEDYLQHIEELQCQPEYSPIHSSQAFAQRPSDDAQSQSFDDHCQPSYDLSSIWLPPNCDLEWETSVWSSWDVTFDALMSLLVYFRPLGIENGIGKAKKIIWSKRFMNRSQEEENRESCDCTYTPCVRTGPWEHQRFASASLVRPHDPYVRPYVLVENDERNIW